MEGAGDGKFTMEQQNKNEKEQHQQRTNKRIGFRETMEKQLFLWYYWMYKKNFSNVIRPIVFTPTQNEIGKHIHIDDIHAHLHTHREREGKFWLKQTNHMQRERVRARSNRSNHQHVTRTALKIFLLGINKNQNKSQFSLAMRLLVSYSIWIADSLVVAVCYCFDMGAYSFMMFLREIKL